MLKDRLKELRKKRELSQRALAKLFGVSPSTIAMYEVGQREPDPKTLDKLASFFGVSTDYLLGRTNTSTPTDKITSSLSDDPDLADFWDKLNKRGDLRLFFKQTKDLSPADIKKVMRIIKAIEDEEADD